MVFLICLFNFDGKIEEPMLKFTSALMSSTTSLDEGVPFTKQIIAPTYTLLESKHVE